MDEVNGSECVPDLKELEVKVGRKTPEGLLRWMRQDAAQRGEHSKVIRQESAHSGEQGLDEKIRKLKVEMAHLRAVDVKILQQLVALHEGIEAAKWLMEERGLLTSHCSSLTGSQYSLGGSWSSLHEPHDKLDNISIGSYLDTLADDLDEYCTSSGAESVLCSAPACTDNSKPAQVKPNGPKGDVRPSNLDSNHEEASKSNGANTPVLDGTVKQDTDSPKALAAERLAKTLSPKGKIYKNGKVELESCKMNGKVHLEYDAHWRWVQSQDDVTFL
ncbi:leucine rich adaptor protein 1 [Tachysurus vachellii]|uniref:leucine rich adaptor protein 1 n=1 Tax=Tachysurus vachellii TaxID=175792 RepID=UPI00296A9268|nr:leucine rich adaptor protein 1 [Tachysurus vachellii]